MIAHTQTVFANDPRGIPGDCLRTAVAALLDLPTEEVPHFLLFDDEWYKAWTMWCRSHGYTLDRPSSPPPARACIAMGQSPRGVYHAVVWQDEACLHDPHPSRGGLTAPDSYWTISR